MLPSYISITIFTTMSTKLLQMPVWILWILCCYEKVSSQQVTVCSPNNTTTPLTCTDNQWIHIIAELYAPQDVGTGSGSCAPDLTSCNNYVYSTGLQANCNGPQSGTDGCREDVHLTEQLQLKPCLQSYTNFATTVMYSCIDSTDIFDVCNANARLTSQFSSSSQMVYLASSDFPATSSNGLMCNCELQGSNLKVEAFEVNVDARLPWHGDTSTDPQHQAVLSIYSDDQKLWTSGDCAACTSITTLNSILVSSVTHGGALASLTLTYSDFGLANQNVWLKITELGPELNISCGSSPLPNDKIITTPPPPTTTSTSPSTSATTPKSSQKTTTTTTTTKGVNQEEGGDSGEDGELKERRSTKGDGGNSDDTAVIVLVVLVILLLISSGFLGFFIYRRRDKCRGDGDERGFKPMLQTWYRNCQWPACCRQPNCQRPEGDGAAAENVGFDELAVAGGEAGQRSNYNPHFDKHSQKVKAAVKFNDEGDGDREKSDGGYVNKDVVETVETDDGPMVIFSNSVYQSHKDLVEEEAARVRQNKRRQKELELSIRSQTAEAPDVSSHRHAKSYPERSGHSAAVEADYDNAVSPESLHHDTALSTYYATEKVDDMEARETETYLKSSVYEDIIDRPSLGVSEERRKGSRDSEPKSDLLSREERDMFVALGLSSGTEEHADKVGSDTTEMRNISHADAKPKTKVSRPSLISDILEMSLKDIKEQRQGNQEAEMDISSEDRDDDVGDKREVLTSEC